MRLLKTRCKIIVDQIRKEREIKTYQGLNRMLSSSKHLNRFISQRVGVC